MSNIFSNMPRLNLTSILLITIAKLSGMIGVCVGFIDSEFRKTGGILLTIALISIFCSVSCSMIQLSRDKKRFDLEDQEKKEIRNLISTKRDLELKIKELESQKLAISQLIIRKG